LIVNGIVTFKWLADFVYDDGDQTIREDSKGVRTPLYQAHPRHTLPRNMAGRFRET